MILKNNLFPDLVKHFDCFCIVHRQKTTSLKTTRFCINDAHRFSLLDIQSDLLRFGVMGYFGCIVGSKRFLSCYLDIFENICDGDLPSIASMYSI